MLERFGTHNHQRSRKHGTRRFRSDELLAAFLLPLFRLLLRLSLALLSLLLTCLLLLPRLLLLASSLLVALGLLLLLPLCFLLLITCPLLLLPLLVTCALLLPRTFSSLAGSIRLCPALPVGAVGSGVLTSAVLL